MGTNYFLRPKGYDDLDSVNKKYSDIISKLNRDYIDELKDLISSSSKISNDYYNLFNYDEILNKLNDVSIYIRWPIEVPEIHICKISAGWVPSFEANNKYKSFKEFEVFYKDNQDILDIVDEYDRKIKFEELKESLFKHIEADNLRDHSEYYDLYYDSGSMYWKDDFGFDWIRQEFF